MSVFLFLVTALVLLFRGGDGSRAMLPLGVAALIGWVWDGFGLLSLLLGGALLFLAWVLLHKDVTLMDGVCTDKLGLLPLFVHGIHQVVSTDFQWLIGRLAEDLEVLFLFGLVEVTKAVDFLICWLWVISNINRVPDLEVLHRNHTAILSQNCCRLGEAQRGAATASLSGAGCWLILSGAGCCGWNRWTNGWTRLIAAAFKLQINILLDFKFPS